MVQATGIDHVTLCVKNLEAAEYLFTKILRFRCDLVREGCRQRQIQHGYGGRPARCCEDRAHAG